MPTGCGLGYVSDASTRVGAQLADFKVYVFVGELRE